MTEDELMPLCKFFRKGKSFSTEEEEELADTLSSIERNCVHRLMSYQLLPGEAPRKVFDDYVAAMIGKWHPFECNELWELYTRPENETATL